jgi:BirA family biotin operon repressor/biotin-[acetyl-CoA-carboxylase] ligase
MDLRSTFQKATIVRFLLDAGNRPVSGSVLCEALSCTRQAVWKSVKSLLEEGFVISGKPHEGYRLVSLPEYDLAPSLIGAWLQIRSAWKGSVLLYDAVSSTQLAAKEQARKGVTHGTTVIAESQFRGRGRLNRSWVAHPNEGIAMSVILYPKLKPYRLQLVNLAAGMAVGKAIREKTGIPCSLKWPNDILVSGRKVTGILSEASLDQDRILFVVTGIGINVNTPLSSFPGELSGHVTSLREETGRTLHRGDLVVEVLSELFRYISKLEKEPSDFLDDYRAQCSSLGQRVLVDTGEEKVEGTALDIHETGALIVSSSSGIRLFTAADVVHATFPGLHSELL